MHVEVILIGWNTNSQLGEFQIHMEFNVECLHNDMSMWSTCVSKFSCYFVDCRFLFYVHSA